MTQIQSHYSMVCFNVQGSLLKGYSIQINYDWLTFYYSRLILWLCANSLILMGNLKVPSQTLRWLDQQTSLQIDKKLWKAVEPLLDTGTMAIVPSIRWMGLIKLINQVKSAVLIYYSSTTLLTPSLSLMLMLAFLSTRSFTNAKRPFWAATCRGVIWLGKTSTRVSKKSVQKQPKYHMVHATSVYPQLIDDWSTSQHITSSVCK